MANKSEMLGTTALTPINSQDVHGEVFEEITDEEFEIIDTIARGKGALNDFLNSSKDN